MDPSTHLFWITSRAAGAAAMVFSSVAVGFGLAMAGKLVKGSAPDRRVFHEILSLATMVAIAVHGLTLVGDQFLHPGLLDVTVPFVFSYQRLATSIGIIAGWGMIVLGLSYYARKRIGQNRWKVIHRFTLLAWIGGLAHTFMEGTDAGQVWFVALILGTAAPGLALLALRVAGRPGPGGATVAGRRATGA